MARRTLLLLASIMISAFGTALIWLYVQQADDRARGDQVTIPVWTAAETLSPGTPADRLEGKVIQRPMVVSDLPVGAVTDRKAIAGQVTRQTVFAGEPLLAAQFDRSGASGQLTARSQGLSVSLNEPNRLASVLRPNDHVAVWFVKDAGTPTASTTLLVPRTRVIAVGAITDATNSVANRPVSNSPQVVLELSGRDAARVMASTDHLYFTLLRGEEQASPTDNLAAGALFRG